jgi:hypothetical protein
LTVEYAFRDDDNERDDRYVGASDRHCAGPYVRSPSPRCQRILGMVGAMEHGMIGEALFMIVTTETEALFMIVMAGAEALFTIVTTGTTGTKALVMVVMKGEEALLMINTR